MTRSHACARRPRRALAIRALAAPGSTTAALIGTGRQAWTHLEMLGRELPGLDAAGRRRAGAVGGGRTRRPRPRGRHPRCRGGDDRDAVDGADVVVTVTASSEPLFAADVVGDRTLLCAVGATKYDRREIGADVVARCAAVVCDDVAGSQVECGDLIDAAARGAFDWERRSSSATCSPATVDVAACRRRPGAVRDAGRRDPRCRRRRARLRALTRSDSKLTTLQEGTHDPVQPPQHGGGRARGRRRIGEGQGARRRLGDRVCRRRRVADRRQAPRQRASRRASRSRSTRRSPPPATGARRTRTRTPSPARKRSAS